MMKGLMQEVPLVVPLILRRASELGRGMPVVSAQPSGVDRRSWADVCERALRLAAVLEALGVDRGTPVGSYAWNSHRHLELFYAAPCSGRPLHAVNVRLFDDQVVYCVEHAGDEVLFVDASLTGQLAPLRHRLPVREYVVMEDGGEVDDAFASSPRLEELLSTVEPPAELPPVAEDDAASICFTSGTTGRPKAVVYSHRSVVLHAMGALMADSHAIRRGDVVLAVTPMFHVNCWGLPYSCGLAPAGLVLPGHDRSPEALARLIEAERASVAAGIPTIWVQMQDVFESGESDLSSLRTILCGGAEAPRSLIARYTTRGIRFLHAWGMTEMSPSGTAAWVEPGTALEEEGVARQGVPVPGVELRVVAEDGRTLPWDGESVGELEVRGPWVARAYLDPDDDANAERFHDGWLRTGDLARIAPDGTVELVDRTKDLIKSGGEWISSLELERLLAAHPGVREAAAFAVPHERWGERPAVVVVPADDDPPDPAELVDFLRGKLARWWLPDVVELVPELPHTGVGKVDKRRVRELYAERLASRAADAEGVR
jgi:fatty-acyl-CoA synthase